MAALNAPVTAALVAALEPWPSDEVLEVAGGTGELAAALAGRVARLVSTDLSPAMVEAAVRRELLGVEHLVMDMQALDFPDASFDSVVCRFGYMLAPDPLLACRETRRVLRPGGRLAFATWAPAKRNPWATAWGPVLLERGLVEPPKPGEPGQFALSDPDEIAALVRAAGFDRVTVREVEIEHRSPGWEEFRRAFTSLAASTRQVLESLDDATRAEVDEAARARLERFRTADGYVVPGVALVTSAS